MKTEPYEYRDQSSVLEGYISWDDRRSDRRAGVLVFHEWMGITDHERQACNDLADAGYLALAGDIYGKGDRPTGQDQAAQYAGRYRTGDRALMRQRAQAALAALRAHPLCDATRIAAIGFCFGGTVALELARSGADLKGVATFHAGLSTSRPASPAGTVKAKILTLHGADDPYVPPPEVAAFQDEMRTGGVDWQFVQHGGAVHSYTNEAAGNDPKKGFAYNEQAARRSWQMMLTFFDEVLS
ncbi:MAG: dienelactone hydrolase family protein [Acidiferrobacteraceae bacterium]